MADLAITNKKCKRCSVIKSIDHFNKSKWSIDGLFHICKSCTRGQDIYHFSIDYDMWEERRKIESNVLRWLSENR